MSTNHGNTGKCGSVFKPRPDETPVPCPDGYMSTDCVYPSQKVNLAPLEIDPGGTMTDVLNCLMMRIREMEKELSMLRRDLNRLKN